MTARTPQRQQLIDLLAPVIASAGYDLEDLSVTAAGRRSLIRITVDADNGIDLDGVATVSRSISAALDDDTDGADPAFAGPYVLEVSSPGVDRPLTEPRHWRRAAGRLVEFPVTENASRQVITGRVTALEGSELVVDIAGSESRFPLISVGPGRVQVEFSRPGQSPDDTADSDLGDGELEDSDLEDDQTDDDFASDDDSDLDFVEADEAEADEAETDETEADETEPDETETDETGAVETEADEANTETDTNDHIDSEDDEYSDSSAARARHKEA